MDTLRDRICFPATLVLAVLLIGLGGCELPGESDTVDSCPDGVSHLEMADVVMLTNQARAVRRNCGGVAYEPAAAVTWSDSLAQVALRHSTDMAQNEFLSHQGSNGSALPDRLNAGGYPWRAAAENLLVGTDIESVQAAIDAWLGSPGHCKNIMNPEYNEVGVAVVNGSYKGQTAWYWTMVLAHPNCPDKAN